MNSFKRLFIISGLIVMIGLIATVVFLNEIHDSSKMIERNWLPSAIHVSHINTLTSDYRILELQHILSLEQNQMIAYEEQMDQKTAMIHAEMASYEPLITTDNEKQLYAVFGSKWSEYLKHSAVLLQHSRKNSNSEATAISRGEAEILFNDLSNSLVELVKENKSAAQLESTSAGYWFAGSLINLIFMAGIAGVFIYKTTRRLKGMFDRVVRVCTNIITEQSYITAESGSTK
ncbi:MCP four helix bundle domain-containing protein [bacterium]|nr:MCP four helix bundle domain-containing protein [bacterium]